MKRILVLFTALVVLSGGSLLAAEADGPVDAQQSPPAEETIELRDETKRSKFIDVGRKGESVGDFFLNRSVLFDEQGAQAGTLVTRCVLHFKPYLLCDGVYNLTGRGDIAFTNAVDTAHGGPLLGPLTGGDGEFADVAGQLVIDFEENVTTLEIIRAGS
jgi:hypothetical protein